MKFHYPDLALPPLLIVDDLEDDIFLLRHRLREGGVANPILAFGSSTEALSCLDALDRREVLPSMIFTDIRMPVESGFAFIAAIRRIPAWDDVRVIVVTSSNDTTDLVRALELGANGYLIKFPPPEILAEFVRRGPWFATPQHAATSATAESDAVHA